jgi:2-polyprenyl-3-methyl-5-hydroxy-6-metoxy-1,4-benzoquinol methylase
VASGYDYELRTCQNRWTYVQCARCEHIWLNPRPALDALDVIYPTSYYAYNYQDISAVARRAKQAMDEVKMRSILRCSPEPPTSYLDVGCGDGRYLGVLARKGLPHEDLHGLELDGATVDRLRSQGFQVHQERVEDTQQFAPEMFDLITIFHVIEHVGSPSQVLRRLADWLRPGGVLAVETPNVDSLDARLFAAGTWGGFHIPRHWHLFQRSTLARLLESVGLVLKAVRYQPGHAFWMYSVHHELLYGGRQPRPRSAKFFDPFASVIPLAAFTAFDLARAAMGAKTSAMLMIAEKPN